MSTEPHGPEDPTADLPAPPGGSDATVTRADAAAIAKLCIDGGVPDLITTLLTEGATIEAATARIAAVGEAGSLVRVARMTTPSIPEDFAATMLAEGKTVPQIRSALFDRMAAEDGRTAVISHAPARGGAASAAPKPVDLVADMKRRHGIAA